MFLEVLTGLCVAAGEEPESEASGGLTIVGQTPDSDALATELRRFVGGQLTARTFTEIAEAIVRHYEKQDRPVVDVWFPEQDITEGILTVRVEEGRVGEVILTGAAHFNRGRLASGIRIQPGDVVSRQRIQQELDWLNRNPFHDANVRVSDDHEEATLEFVLSDRRPIRFTTGFENSGVALLGEERFNIGVAYGNLFGFDHLLGYQFFFGESFDRFRGHAVTYQLPLPWRHTLLLRGALVNSSAPLEVSEESGQTDGESWLTGAQYQIPLRSGSRFTHQAGAGFDFKSTNNSFEFDQAQNFDTPIEVAQFTLDYDAQFESENATTALDASLVWSPGGVGAQNTDEAFQRTRPGAESSYVYVRGQLEHWHPLGGASGTDLALRASGQWTENTLVPSEQFSPSGYDAIRGYDERRILGDSGFTLSAELHSPPLEFGVSGTKGQLRLLAFIDYGMAFNNTASPQLPSSTELASYGAGVRVKIAEHMAVRFDYGQQIDSGKGRGHVAVSLSF